MNEHDELKSLEELAKDSGKYPVDAFNFVREGLKFTVTRQNQNTQEEKHITGQDLCWGLRDFALKRWGLLASVVLHNWNISSTMDFGKIVFYMVDAGWMAKKEEDTINDFNDVYDFRSAFDTNLTIEMGKKEKVDPED
jgi:uncharacterized repeat protein (TIGR04138 family)